MTVTRQQAAEAIRTWWSRHSYSTDWDWNAQNLAVDLDNAGLLASSSPALPEPPAPTEDGDWLMPGLPVLWLQRSSVHPIRISSLEMAPTEARLLASTLLAAADVAEEGTR